MGALFEPSGRKSVLNIDFRPRPDGSKQNTVGRQGSFIVGHVEALQMQGLSAAEAGSGKKGKTTSQKKPERTTSMAGLFSPPKTGDNTLKVPGRTNSRRLLADDMEQRLRRTETGTGASGRRTLVLRAASHDPRGVGSAKRGGGLLEEDPEESRGGLSSEKPSKFLTTKTPEV